MSETTMASDVEHDDHGHDEHVDHATEKSYWVIFAVLGVLTAIEVAWHYLGLSGAALVWPLIAMMLAKFVLVAGWFMHLKFDLSIRNGSTFTYTFGFGLVLALIVYAIVFATFMTS